MVDIFSTFVFNRTVEHLERPASFLLDPFFSSIQTEEPGKFTLTLISPNRALHRLSPP